MQTDKAETDSTPLHQLLTKLAEFRRQETPEYMTTPQAAAYLGLSTQFLEIARCRGGGPKYIKLAQAVRYSKADLDEFMLARRKHHTAEVGNV